MNPLFLAGAFRRAAPVVALSVAATVATACGSAEPEPQGPVDADTYVRVMGELADLQRFPPSAPDEKARDATADSARRDILARYDVEPGELLEYAEQAGANPGLMLELSERIVAVSDSLAERRLGRPIDSEAAAEPADTGDAAADTGGGAEGRDTADGEPPARPSIDELRRRMRDGRDSAPAPRQ